MVWIEITHFRKPEILITSSWFSNQINAQIEVL